MAHLLPPRHCSMAALSEKHTAKSEQRSHNPGGINSNKTSKCVSSTTPHFRTNEVLNLECRYTYFCLKQCAKNLIHVCKFNQRTNGPVNAHLRPEIYTNKIV